MQLRFALLAAVLVVVGFAGSVAAAESTLETRSLLGGKVEMLVPSAFQPMAEEVLKLKYPTERRPTEVLSNDAASVNVALNHTQDRIAKDQLAEAHRVTDAMFKKMYPSAQWFRSEVTSLNGRRFYVLELRTPAIDTEVRNLMVGTSVGGRLLLVSINMTKELESEWLPLANKMINSIVIKD